MIIDGLLSKRQGFSEQRADMEACTFVICDMIYANATQMLDMVDLYARVSFPNITALELLEFCTSCCLLSAVMLK